MTQTAARATAWRDWSLAAPTVAYQAELDAPGDPASAAILLATGGLSGEYVVYERHGVWHVALGSALTVTVDAERTTARSADRAWTRPSSARPTDDIADALAELGRAHPGCRVYGWATFELAHVLHGDPSAAGTQPLLHIVLPTADITLTPGRARVLASDPALGERIAARLRHRLPAPGTPLPDTATLLQAGGADYRNDVAATIADIEAGRIDKAVVSRTVPLPSVDLPTSYLACRRANTPARSFLLDVGGWQAAGFSPETVVEVEADGRVTTQPLAGTRALGHDATANERLRAELLTDAKEVHEHAISVRLACAELATVCRPGTVAIEEFMVIRERGSVQHLASRVAGRLAARESSWSAFAALFPAVTATGAPTAAALHVLHNREREPRGLYGGAVFLADTDGLLDAALVLRTVFRRDGRTWLRAGAGVMRQSTPDREYEETCEKLRSVAPHLRPA